MAKKYTKSEIEGMIKNLKEKEKKARSKWGKAVLQDAQWLLENVLENMKDGEEVEINETLLLNGAKSWKDFSYGGCAYVANIDIARHYATPSQFKQLEKKDWEISENETLYDVQARALRQAWWAIRDEMNGTTEFSMSLCNFSYQDVEGATIKDSLTKTNFDMTKVVWKINGKDEQSKEFDNFLDAMKFQGEIVKKYKKKLEYAEYKKIGKSNFDMEEDEYWGLLIEYGIATEDELQLITDINGYSEETLDDVLYARTGYRSWEQYCEANDFSIIDDTKDVLRATGKLAGNIVKNTTDKGGLLMF
jgi:hypothetical protein